MDDYKLGINLGWYKEEASNQEIFNQYKNWLNICRENNIKLVRIFLARWSINALFDDSKLNLLFKIIKEADSFGVEVILILNHFTDFIDQHHRELAEAKYVWDSYPLKKESIKSFFTNLDKNFVAKIKKVLNKIKEYKNVTKIELFNEIDQVNINNKILIKWISELERELSLYQKRYKFYVSVASHDNLKLFKNNLSIPVDIHIYNFPSEYAFKNIEYFKGKLDNSYYLGEYAKFSDNSHLEVCESKSYFCSGLWGSYLQGLKNSPLHWWWQELLINNEYLKIISLFRKYVPKNFNLVSNNNFKISDLKVIELGGNNSIRKDKILFRLKTLILHPTYLRAECGAIVKFIKKILSSCIDKEEVLIRSFENQKYVYFYCEPKNCQKINFNLHAKGANNIDNIELINLLNGTSKQMNYGKAGEIFNIECKFSSNHLIRIKKSQNG